MKGVLHCRQYLNYFKSFNQGKIEEYITGENKQLFVHDRVVCPENVKE